MIESFCKKCSFKDYPNCMVSKIITNEDFNNFINNNNKYIEYPVCHKNAQILNDGIMTPNPTCDNCGLCKLACVSLDLDSTQINEQLENIVFSNLNLLNILLSNITNENIQVGSEIHFEGNSRNKRIDIVIKHDKKIFLIKLINSVDKREFYSRSYDEIINQYSNLYKDYQFDKILLFKRNVNTDFNIDSLISLLKDGVK
jgi:hypothetical protein